MLAEPEGAWSSGRGAPREQELQNASQEGAGEEKRKPSLFLPSHLLLVPLIVEPEVTGASQCCAGARSYRLVRAKC